MIASSLRTQEPGRPGWRARLLAVAGLALVLQGCESGHADLQTWMDETRQNTPSRVDQLEAPKRFEPYRYQSGGGADPFALSRLRGASAAMASAGASAQPPSSLRPNDKRVREPLETIPLEQFQMVGSLQRGRENIGLLRADKHLHQIRVGQYIGQNHGRVMQISNERILIRELVEDAAGEWTQRDTEMRLQESAS